MRNSSIALLFFLIVGFLLGQYKNSTTKTPPKVGLVCPYLDDKICSDIEKYKIEKEMETKYKIAEDILSDMIKIFLADLGLRLADKNFELDKFTVSSESTVVNESQPSNDPRSMKKAFESRAKALEERREARKENSQEKRGNEDDILKKHALEEKQRKRLEKELWWSRRYSPYTKSLLDQLKLEHPGKYLFHSLPATARTNSLKEINGNYTGLVFLKNKKRHLWQMRLEVLSDSARGQSPTGKFSLNLTKEGEAKPFLTNNSKGQFNSIRVPRMMTTALIIKASDDLYFQTYVTQSNELFGSAYQRNYQNFERVGHFYLKQTQKKL